MTALLQTVVDPEIPVLTIAEMGMLRGVQWQEATGEWEVLITPTYSGCPATDMIRAQIRMTLLENGISNVRITQVLSPAWTTDWMTDTAKKKLRQYGIAPPVGKSIDGALLENTVVLCPRCGSSNTHLVSAFSSTACKAFYTCNECLEPFDHFKCH
ncbi:MAG: phenylacetate-CoA oxygenase subunit PaaJ [Bacteroidetes bacterium]|uniref:1,2-phenylacetyl-CoA epoxidase subunit PaaD n=1 Tax=Phnomibacter sp. TaxID=2836217 RepID=UPI002FDDBB88|nr:phenylacetate-CoA oxygenase subunit PaaJ [Bacteroidota bacterium]